MQEDYRDSIIFPFRDICGQSCNSDGTEQGNTAWVVIILCLNCWQLMYSSSREFSLAVGSNAHQWKTMLETAVS